MTYGKLLEALYELSPEQLNEQVLILRDREIYVMQECGIVGEIEEPSLQEKLENEFLLHETYPLLII